MSRNNLAVLAMAVLLMIGSSCSSAAAQGLTTIGWVDGTPERKVELLDVSAQVSRALTRIRGRVQVTGVLDAEGDAPRLSVVTMSVEAGPLADEPVVEAAGRLRSWAYGVLLEGRDHEPVRLAGPLEPVLARLGDGGRRMVGVRGVVRDGVLVVLTLDLQPPTQA